MVKREDAYYYKLLLMTGIDVGYDDWLNNYLETEQPLSDIVLELSLCGSDVNKTISCLHRYCAEEAFDESIVCEKLRFFLKESYETEKIDKKEVAAYMYRFASAHGDPFDYEYDSSLWDSMAYMDELYSLADDGILSWECFDNIFFAYLNDGTPVDWSVVWKKTKSKNPKLSETERKYKYFDTISTFMLCFGLLLSFVFGAFFLFTKSDEYKALWGCLLSINMVFYLFVPSKIDKKREMYLELLRKEREKTERAGLFKEIFDAHRQDCFEANLICDKWLYEEYHNNTIDIGIVRNNHEFLILFDEHTLSIAVDEETDHPTEDIVPLSHFTTIDEVIGFLNGYTYRHSNQEQTPDWFDKPDVEVLFEFNGTRKTFVGDGYRPCHLICGNYLTSGIHHYYNTLTVPRDGTAKGTITFVSPEAYPHCLWEGKKIPIQEGERVVGYATVLKVFNELLLGEENT